MGIFRLSCHSQRGSHRGSHREHGSDVIPAPVGEEVLLGDLISSFLVLLPKDVDFCKELMQSLSEHEDLMNMSIGSHSEDAWHLALAEVVLDGSEAQDGAAKIKPFLEKVWPDESFLALQKQKNERAAEESTFAAVMPQSGFGPLLPRNSRGSIRRCLFLAFDNGTSSIVGRFVASMVSVMITFSIVCMLLETLPSLQERPAECQKLLDAGLPLTVKACEPQPIGFFIAVEMITIVFFTFDYMVKLCTAHSLGPPGCAGGLRTTLAFMMLPMSVIDLLSILPFYLDFILRGQSETAAKLRFLRLLRFIRIFKFARYSKAANMMATVLHRAGQPLIILLFFCAIVIVLFGSLLFIIEGRRFSVAPEFTEPSEPGGVAPYPTGVYVRRNQAQIEDEVTPFRSIPYAMWFACTTMTTVGYGDIYPTTVAGKAAAVVMFYIGVLFLALPVGVVTMHFEEEHFNAQQKAQQKVDPEVEERRSLAWANPPTPTSKADKEVLPWWPSRAAGVRRFIFNCLEDPTTSVFSRWYSRTMFVVILISSVMFVVESIPDYNHTPDTCVIGRLTVKECTPRPEVIFGRVEAFCISIFTLDYLLRVLTVHAAAPEAFVVEAQGEWTPLRQTWVYMLQWLNLVDIFSILPFYFEFALGGGGGSLTTLRIARLIRVFRVLRAPKMRACAAMLGKVVRDSAPGLLVCFVFTILTSVVCASIIFFAEGSNFSVDHLTEKKPMGMFIRPTKDGYGVEETPFQSSVYSMWWYYVTATTVGYGDDFPTTTFGRIVSCLVFYVGIILVAFPITIVGQSFDKYYGTWLHQLRQESTEDREGELT